MSAFPVVYPDDEPDELCCEGCGSENVIVEPRSYPTGVSFLGTAEWFTSEMVICRRCGHAEEL